MPIASNGTLGGVKIDGNNLSIDSNTGVLSATNTEYTAGTNISIINDVISATAASGITNLDNYSQTNAISINSEDNNIELKTKTTARLEIANI